MVVAALGNAAIFLTNSTNNRIDFVYLTIKTNDMKVSTIKNYSGVIYEMVGEVNQSKPFAEVRRETAAYLRKHGHTEASRDISFCNEKELAEAYLAVEKEQKAFDVRN